MAPTRPISVAGAPPVAGAGAQELSAGGAGVDVAGALRNSLAKASFFESEVNLRPGGVGSWSWSPRGSWSSGCRWRGPGGGGPGASPCWSSGSRPSCIGSPGGLVALFQQKIPVSCVL